ncbi:MAG TPA: RsmE family RNA methyltransferase [Kofleriaceae bacterium]|nr:RsmE family RNA methyltransferase [Kofleriaceae bacterium]
MRIFVDPAELAAGELVLRGDEHHYLARVRRARPGDRVELLDGAGRRATATIARIADAETTLAAELPERIVPRPPFVRALVPLIKGDRMDTCLEKLVEVGVSAIVVWPAARSVARLDDARRDARGAKYQALARAAARQSGRADVPEVAIAADLAAALAALPSPSAGARLVLVPASDAAPDPGTADDVTIVSGPEGGLAPEELDRLTGPAGFVAAGLGPRVLRAETAPVVAVALLRAATHS